MSTRPRDYESNGATARRAFRPYSDHKQGRGGNGNGAGHANGNGNGGYAARAAQKQAPPEVTNAENFYYLKQMSSRTPMVIVLTDGEQVHGWIEWYDKTCLKVNREGAPNLLIQKHCIKYLFKAEELNQ